MIKSPIKWAGGKSWLDLPEHSGLWIEPFAGSAAQFFKRAPSRAVLSDNNPHLINFYRQVRDNVEWVLEGLPYAVPTGEQYLALRALHNSHVWDNTPQGAALFYTLNRTCFNGLWRVNKRGEFNVPWCKDPERQVYGAHDLRSASARLQSTALQCCEFDRVFVSQDSAAYLDPPYYDTFDGYSPTGFGNADHLRVRDYARGLRDRGVSMWLSYNDHPHIRAMYADWRIEQVQAPRGVRGGHTTAPELLITY